MPTGANKEKERSALSSSIVARSSCAISRMREPDGILSPKDKDRMRWIASETISIGRDIWRAMK